MKDDSSKTKKIGSQNKILLNVTVVINVQGEHTSPFYIFSLERYEEHMMDVKS